jgi:hypothetical protein
MGLPVLCVGAHIRKVMPVCPTKHFLHEGGAILQAWLIERRPLPAMAAIRSRTMTLLLERLSTINGVIAHGDEGNNGVTPDVAGSTDHKDSWLPFTHIGGHELHPGFFNSQKLSSSFPNHISYNLHRNSGTQNVQTFFHRKHTSSRPVSLGFLP